MSITAASTADDLAERRDRLQAAIRLSKQAIASSGGRNGGVGSAPTGSGAAAPAVGRINTTAVAFNVFVSLLETDGLRAAIYSLLRLTDYRFISIFRFKNGMATSAVHVDREDLTVQQAPEVTDTATYCSFVRKEGVAFATEDSVRDPRTADHVAREVVRSYCGIAITTPDGELIGTLCHYDLVPRDPSQLDTELLAQTVSVLAAPGLVPDYPTAD